MADAGRGAGCDDVAGHEGQPEGQLGYDAGHLKVHLLSGCILFHDAVDAGDEVHVGVVDLGSGHDPGAHRAVLVEALALEPLRAVLLGLHIAGGRVVDDGVTEHVIERVCFRNVATALPDDDGQFALPIDFRRYRGIEGDGTEGAVEGVDGLGEKDGVRGQLFVGLAEVFGFLEVRDVVPADGVDVAGESWKRWEQFDVGEGRTRVSARGRLATDIFERSGAGLDEREHGWAGRAGDLENVPVGFHDAHLGWATGLGAVGDKAQSLIGWDRDGGLGRYRLRRRVARDAFGGGQDRCSGRRES